MHESTIFSQLLQFVPRHEFEKAVSEYQSEKHCKGFKSWHHFVALLFAQLSGQDGLRGVETGLASQQSKLYHLGVRETKRSTLSYANNHRSAAVFERVFATLLQKTLVEAPSHRFRFKNDLFSFDATTIDLCLGLYDWATFRKRKGGIKLHVQLNHNGYIPSFVCMTTAKQHESTVFSQAQLKTGDVVVFDRGYVDFERFASHCRQGIYFVTRLKKNADYRVVERRSVQGYANISSDQIITMNGFYTSKKCPLRLRRIRVKDPQTGKAIVVLTNQMKWSPETVAAVYRDRWQIEIFFKNMKQYLKIKSFLGTSKNAILCQIWVALIAYLLLSYMKFISRHAWTISKLMNVIPIILFAKTDLLLWLNDPFGVSRFSPKDPEQLALI